MITWIYLSILELFPFSRPVSHRKPRNREPNRVPERPFTVEIDS